MGIAWDMELWGSELPELRTGALKAGLAII
jgi:hypothetical protein